MVMFMFDCVEMFADFFHPEWIPNSNDSFCNLFRPDIKVVNGSTLVNDQF
jgi:hypothetical protein